MGSQFTIGDIAAALGVSEPSVQTRASRRGFVKRQTYRVKKSRADGTVYWTEAEIEKLMAMKIKRIPVRKIAESFDRTVPAIHAQIYKIEREGTREVSAVKMRRA